PDGSPAVPGCPVPWRSKDSIDGRPSVSVSPAACQAPDNSSHGDSRSQSMNTNTAVPAPQASVESHPVYSGEDPRRFRINVTTIGDLLLSAADRHGDKPALIFPDETVSYNQLAERALHAARGLQALGVGNRDHVGILMHSCVRLAEMFFAVSLCGAVPVTINPRYRPSELAYLIENADLVTVVTSDEL